VRTGDGPDVVCVVGHGIYHLYILADKNLDLGESGEGAGVRDLVVVGEVVFDCLPAV
jgi:hypothetical protein